MLETGKIIAANVNARLALWMLMSRKDIKDETDIPARYFVLTTGEKYKVELGSCSTREESKLGINRQKESEIGNFFNFIKEIFTHRWKNPGWVTNTQLFTEGAKYTLSNIESVIEKEDNVSDSDVAPQENGEQVAEVNKPLADFLSSLRKNREKTNIERCSKELQVLHLAVKGIKGFETIENSDEIRTAMENALLSLAQIAKSIKPDSTGFTAIMKSITQLKYALSGIIWAKADLALKVDMAEQRFFDLFEQLRTSHRALSEDSRHQVAKKSKASLAQEKVHNELWEKAALNRKRAEVAAIASEALSSILDPVSDNCEVTLDWWAGKKEEISNVIKEIEELKITHGCKNMEIDYFETEFDFIKNTTFKSINEEKLMPPSQINTVLEQFRECRRKINGQLAQSESIVSEANEKFKP
ncbi:hypothetical protein FNU76_18330 [Chitinimonas arctica]|uniref:Uncharacterized protein n=1 Tax=Chitinimonas arctica TaxID=2594795 RepID=A0A516SJ26_9NEIS|nr:hypothetical protein [Chitinimonas arctica]QDQ28146.1 hypothetical protein FNU76_18330 [Chitinimonas arctica]